jgi:RecA/RadA recombinase
MAGNKILKKLIKKIDNPYATIAIDGIIGGDIKNYVNSGSYILNAILSGDIYKGFAAGKVTALAGRKGSGKSFILFKTVQQFLDENPDNLFILFESEGAVTQNMLRERGIDMERVLCAPIMTVEELRNQSITILDQFKEMEDRPNILIGLDSLGMLSTEFEIKTASENTNKADMGKRAQLIKSVFRTITLRLGIMNIPMIITNHTYSTMDMYSPDVMGGGSGLEFAASTIIFLGKFADKETIKGKKVLVGNIVRCTVHKGRLTVEGSFGDILINFKTGINKYFGLLELAIEYKLIHRSGSNYYLGKKVDDEKLLAKSKKELYNNADSIFDEDLLNLLNDAAGEKYKYGSALEDIEEIEKQKLEE